jgi:hypothetical protein
MGHLRISFEQLQYSHQLQNSQRSVGINSGTYLDITPRMLLLAGADDNSDPERLYDHTVLIAEQIPLADTFAFDSLFISNTGHSIHAERPIHLVQQIFDFLYCSPRVPEPSFLIYSANF